MPPLKPFYDDVQAHYDVSDDFYRLFLDPTMTYSCAYFRRDDMTLEEAQRAKIKLSLDKCDLEPGMRLLDVGCGWGTTAMMAAEDYGAKVIGLTLSKNQQATAAAKTADNPNIEIRLQGWEEFDEPVDRIVSIGALEHFRVQRYAAFFERCFKVLPSGASMLIHSIVHGNSESIEPGQPEWSEELLDYTKFMRKYIFPGGQVPPREMVILHARTQGFEVVHLESLRLHYARTLDTWYENLKREEKTALELAGQEVYDRYQRYLTQSAHFFRTGHVDVVQFRMRKP